MNFNPRYHHTTSQLQDEQLIIEAAKLNPEHFGPIYDKYYKQIFGYVYQRMDCKDTAFDVTSQVFLKALTNLNRYEFKGVPFASWLFRIAHSEVMQLFRDQKNKRAINADVGDLKNIYEEVQEPFFEEYLPALQHMIKELPEDDLHMIEMRFFEQRPFKEIAEILNITENNAKVRMYRILERLKKTITNYKI
ncbi:MAG: sigma-70 family RNA polymerase sigma factor [Sphingobacteriaceae bacterium]|jgi:RNA polymerase sigma-70 factor (ECF subfamily)|nr:sigma-70 family RNA polymerase sigma factor [Sphingobacteriaceae bacterium]